MVQKLITPITLGEYFPPEFFNRGMVTSTHMVSCHETSEEDKSGKNEENAFGAELSKTKEDDEIVENLQCLPSLFSIHEMLQLLEKTQIALIQVLKNSSLYATKIKGAKQFEDKGHDCTTCCANITYNNGDEKGVTSNFTTIVFNNVLKTEPDRPVQPFQPSTSRIFGPDCSIKQFN